MIDEATVERLGQEMTPLLRRYPEVAAAYLFGSVAAGRAGPGSDVDLGLVFAERGATGLDHHRLLGALALDLEGVVAPRRLDLVVLEEAGSLFGHRVLLEGRLVYEADRDRRIDFETETVVRALDFRPTWELAARGRVAGLRRWLREDRP